MRERKTRVWLRPPLMITYQSGRMGRMNNSGLGLAALLDIALVSAVVWVDDDTVLIREHLEPRAIGR